MIYFFIILVALFQIIFANLMAIGNIRPDFLLVFVVFIALSKGPLKAAAAGATAGFIKDILSTGAFLNTFSFFLCGVIVGLFAQRFHKEKAFVQPMIVCAACVFVSLVYLFWFSRWDYPQPVAMLAGRIGFPTALYTALVTPPLFFLFSKLTGDAT